VTKQSWEVSRHATEKVGEAAVQSWEVSRQAGEKVGYVAITFHHVILQSKHQLMTASTTVFCSPCNHADTRE
jgi:hypothetical protein